MCRYGARLLHENPLDGGRVHFRHELVFTSIAPATRTDRRHFSGQLILSAASLMHALYLVTMFAESPATRCCSQSVILIRSGIRRLIRRSSTAATTVKILIIKPSALGDIVQALPVLTGLKRRWPAAQIDWVVNDSLQEILEGHPCLRRTILYPRKRWTSPARLPEMWRWGRRLRDEKYDMTHRPAGPLAQRAHDLGRGQPAPDRPALRPRRRARGLQRVHRRHGASPPPSVTSPASSISTSRVQPLDFQLTARAPLPEALAGSRRLHRAASLLALAHQALALALLSGTGRLHARAASFVVVGEGPWFPLDAPGPARRPARASSASARSSRCSIARAGRPQHRLRPGPYRRRAWAGPRWSSSAPPTGARPSPPARSVFVHTAALFCSPCLKRTCWRDTPVECMSLLEPQKIRTALAAICVIKHNNSNALR